jgi:hypothetical protein
MPKQTYTFHISRVFRASTTLDVEATSEVEALQKAMTRLKACVAAEATLTVARPKRTTLEWTITEESPSTVPLLNTSED